MVNKNKVKEVIKQALKNAGFTVELKGEKLMLIDFNDIDYPDYYEIKLERI